MKNEQNELPQDSGVQIVDIFPVHLSGIRFPMLSDSVFNASPNIKLHFELGITGNRICQAQFGASVSFDESPHPFEIEVQIVGVFTSDKADIDMELFVSLIRDMAAQNLYPYVREAVHDLSIKLRVSPITLPLISPEAFRGLGGDTRKQSKERSPKSSRPPKFNPPPSPPNTNKD